MSLPKVEHPTFRHYLKGIEKTIRYRPFTAKEQKILLHADSEEKTESYIDAIRQIIQLCTFDEVDPDTLPIFDVEDLFIRIRSKSVSDVSTISYNVLNDQGQETGETVEVSINLDEVTSQALEGHDRKIMISDAMGIMMRYPSIDAFTNIASSESMTPEDEESLVKSCIECIFTSDEVYSLDQEEQSDIDEFYDSLDTKTLEKINSFFLTMPRVRHDEVVTLNSGEQETIHFEGINDFFG